LTFGDESFGGMIICDSSDQAHEIFRIFNEKYMHQTERHQKLKAAESSLTEEDISPYKFEHKTTTAALILHDVGSKDERDVWITDFKEGKIDFLIVYNMLLTGFDVKRLKKLYVGRVVKQHNLLQALTRVNRRYKHFRYGYVVDFADISAEFDATNKAYFDELQAEYGDDYETFSNIFKSKEEILDELAEIKDTLFHFNIENAELFQQQISQIQDRTQVLKIKNSLENAKSLYNLIRLFGYTEIINKVDFKKLAILYRETENHLTLLNTKEALSKSDNNTQLLNIALEDILFQFTKVSEEELVLADELKDTLRKTRQTLATNFDKKDPEFISLYDELKRLFNMKKLDEVTQDEMIKNIATLTKIYERIKELNRQNNLLKDKYNSDPKYARIHKRLLEKGTLSKKESEIFEALQSIKGKADEQVLQNTKLLNNESYFTTEMTRLVVEQFKNDNKITLNAASAKYINKLIVNEYVNEFNGRAM